MACPDIPFSHGDYVLYQGPDVALQGIGGHVIGHDCKGRVAVMFDGKDYPLNIYPKELRTALAHPARTAARTAPTPCLRCIRWRAKLLRLLGEGSETHRQIYNGWQQFPLAMKHALAVGFGVGCVLIAGIHLIID